MMRMRRRRRRRIMISIINHNELHHNIIMNDKPLSLKYFLEAMNIHRDDSDEHTTLTAVPTV